MQGRLVLPLFLAVLLLTEAASAAQSQTVLFVDLDNSPEEVIAAQKTADRLQKKLIVIPERSSEIQETLLRSHAKFVQYDNEMDSLREKKFSLEQLPQFESNPEYQKIASQFQEHLQYLKTTTQELRPIPDAFALDSVFESVCSQGGSIDSIIISGHFMNGQFTGVVGDMSQIDFFSEIEKYPCVRSHLQALYLWGCYSAAYENAKWWQDNLSSGFDAYTRSGGGLIAGFDLRAPNSLRAPDPQYLANLMARQESLVKASASARSGAADFARLIRAVPGFSAAGGAVCNRLECVEAVEGIEEFEKIESSCTPQLLDRMRGYGDDVLPLLDPTLPMQHWDTSSFGAPAAVADPQPQKDIPCDTDTGYIRSFYTLLKTKEHCGSVRGPHQKQFQEYTSKLPQVGILLFEKQVFANFISFHAADIARLNAIIAACPAITSPDGSIRSENAAHFFEAPLACVSPSAAIRSKTVSRTDVLNFDGFLRMLGFPDYCPVTANGAGGGITQADEDFVREFENEYYTQLLEFKCVPTDWIEQPRANSPLQKPDPRCFAQP